MSALFSHGAVVATPGVLAALADHSILIKLLDRHVKGDWGSVCVDDKAANDAAVGDGGRILSAYAIDPAKPCAGFGDNCIWVITEADRSVTTFLLPEEY